MMMMVDDSQYIIPSEGLYLLVPLLSGMALGLLCPKGALTGTVGILSVI